jgi:hypothetical protein
MSKLIVGALAFFLIWGCEKVGRHNHSAVAPSPIEASQKPEILAAEVKIQESKNNKSYMDIREAIFEEIRDKKIKWEIDVDNVFLIEETEDVWGGVFIS